MNRHGIVAILVGLAVLIGAVALTSHGLVSSQREGCMRGVASNVNNGVGWRFQANGWTAERRYKLQVTKAASVKEDVKREARRAAKVYARVSRGQRAIAGALEERAKIDCASKYRWPF